MRIEVRRRAPSPLPVTMADLAFLLIIFLILTLDPSLGMEVDLPEFRYAVKTADQKSVSLAVARDGSVSVEGRAVTLEDLGAALRAEATNAVVTVFADEAASYEAVDAVLVALRAEERYRVILAAERSP